MIVDGRSLWFGVDGLRGEAVRERGTDTQPGGRPTVVRMQLNSASATSLHLAGSAERTSPVAAQQPSMATNSALHGEGRRTEEKGHWGRP
jgi:hypothetical protein